MSVPLSAEAACLGGSSAPLVNDFSIQVATVNGSGSQTANTVLMRALFQMGVPVSGKNLFPSNIAGLPTWFTIRASKQGYIGRRKEVDFLVAMNAETAREDVMKLDRGAAVVYDEPLKLNELRGSALLSRAVRQAGRSGLSRTQAAQAGPQHDLRRRAGVAARHRAGRGAQGALQAVRRAQSQGRGAELGRGEGGRRVRRQSSAPRPTPTRSSVWTRPRARSSSRATRPARWAALFAGVTVVTWYPITPSSSLVETLIGYLKRFRIDKETGKATFAMVQAEDELAAIGMALGAGWAGARSMTATSGPGISLMAEFTGLGYYAEIPAVIVDVQRVGPSTGLPTRTQQGDILSTAVLSHGDTQHPMYFPSSPSECFTMMQDAFDLAERFQTPVFVMTDLDLGMNNWMSDPFPYPDRADPARQGSHRRRPGAAGRIRTLQRRGRRWRRLPHAARHRSSGGRLLHAGQRPQRPRHLQRAADDYMNNMDRLARKFEVMRATRAAAGSQAKRESRDRPDLYRHFPLATEESREQLRQEYGVESGYFRLRAYPFTKDVVAFIHRHARIYVIDQNRDGQLLQLMRLELSAGRRRQAPQRSLLRWASLGRPHGHGRDRPTRRPYEHRYQPRFLRKRLTASGWKFSPTRAARRRCAPVAATTRFPSASSKRSTTWESSRGAWPNSPGSAARASRPAYFLSMSHGFNAVHGRTPAVATGAMLANRTMLGIRVTRRRRYGFDRHRSVHAPAAAQSAADLHHREQRRVRSDQGPVLGDRGPRVQA